VRERECQRESLCEERERLDAKIYEIKNNVMNTWITEPK
jgi:hypothetical protein